MTAFVTLAGVYNTPVATSIFGAERSRDQDSMTTSRALDQFLSSVEKRAFKIAQLGLRNDDDALDAVQDSMMKLVQSYASRAVDEWRPLFYRILSNRIRDMQRRRTVRGRIMAWLPVRDAEDDEEFDPIAQAPSQDAGPAKRLELDEAIGVLEKAVEELPPRQQQAFPFMLISVPGWRGTRTTKASRSTIFGPQSTGSAPCPWMPCSAGSVAPLSTISMVCPRHWPD
jgi:RNA polymerase sigma-70 factor (ECF subfamily)